MVLDTLSFYRGKKIFVTGHTGFKGSWLTVWLQKLGAEVVGFSLPAESPSHYENLKPDLKSYYEDINDFDKLKKAIKESKPDLVFHLAAQPLVLRSYSEPVLTFDTNVTGSLKVYLAAQQANVKTLVSITTDKVYENIEVDVPFQEGDRYGGHDPYSASKACMEIMTDSYRKSFAKDGFKVVTARAGNVIGGGDWAENRIIPDLVRGAIAGKTTSIRSPDSVRPWQHVLEPLWGYLRLGKMAHEGKSPSNSYNFGPEVHEKHTVREICEVATQRWKKISFNVGKEAFPHEAKTLRLDIQKAKKELGWTPVMDFQKTIGMTLDWYKAYCEEKAVMTLAQIEQFERELGQQ